MTAEPTPRSKPPGVLLLSMPFVGIDRPSLGLSLLKAQLQRAGVDCAIRYLTFDLADFIGLEDYGWICDDLPYTAFVGDWVFARFLYGSRPDEDLAYVEEILVGNWRLSTDDVGRILRVRKYCGLFLDHCERSIPWSDYRLVGFTSTFTQNMASLALAKRIKKSHPEVSIVFGGANWEGEMGLALHEQFDFVDFAFSGEADESFPALVAGLDQPGFDPAGIPGIVYRRDRTSVATAPGSPIVDMDALPLPDFDAYVTDHGNCAAAVETAPRLLLETSRGCWWGAKSHCTFCGLNGSTMGFRSKTASRALDEIRHLVARYGTRRFEVVDNILDMKYFKSLLPMLVEEEMDLELFYEVKANLTREQVRLLAEAGVKTIQPGIESLSDHVLRLMRKGCTGLQNIQLLKWCREYGVRPEWNLLYGFPGETREDYVEQLALLDAVWFLDPPSGYGPVRLDRFSPYHGDPEGFGMINVRSMAPYRYLYPFAEEKRARISYYFDYDRADGRQPDEFARELIARIEVWQQEPVRGSLRLVRRPDGASVLLDDRAHLPRRKILLEGWRSDVYLACDRVTARSRLLEIGESGGASRSEVETFLDLCARLRVLLRNGDSCLALALHPPVAAETGTALPAVETLGRGPGAPGAGIESTQ